MTTNELIESILTSETSAQSLQELREFLDDHLEIDEGGEVLITGESVRILGEQEVVLEDGKQRISLDAIAYAYTGVARLERQMAALLQFLMDKEVVGGTQFTISRLRRILLEVEAETDR
jgi:hypothetical protein